MVVVVIVAVVVAPVMAVRPVSAGAPNAGEGCEVMSVRVQELNETLGGILRSFFGRIFPRTGQYVPGAVTV